MYVCRSFLHLSFGVTCKYIFSYVLSTTSAQGANLRGVNNKEGEKQKNQ